MIISKEEKYLIKKDSKFKKIIDINGPINFNPKNKHEFDCLVEIIISQFISTAAARTIYTNIKNNFDSEYLSEKYFQNLSLSEVKNLGVSLNKAKAIKELSNLFLSKSVLDLSNLSSEELKNQLLPIFGIGPWSINMFEIFCLGNLNIFSSKDAGLRKAMNNFKLVKPGSDFVEYDKYAVKWSPFKTIACLHLWKTVD